MWKIIGSKVEVAKGSEAAVSSVSSAIIERTARFNAEKNVRELITGRMK